MKKYGTRNLTVAVAMAGVALALSPAWSWAQTHSDSTRHAYGPHMMDWGGGWYGMILGAVMMIFVLAAAIALVVLFVRWLGGPWRGAESHRMLPERTPLEILKMRFARGEMDKQEYEDRRRVLGD